MIHLVHVVHSLDVGGTENGVVNLVNALAGDFRHTVVSMTSVGRLARRLPAGAAVYTLGKRPGFDVTALGRLARLLRSVRADVVHSRNWGALDAALLGRLCGARAVIHGEHGREASDPEGRDRRRNRIRRLLSPLIARFVAVSADLREWLVAGVGVPAAKVVTIRNGVDVQRFADEGRKAARRALALADDAFVVGTVGRLDPVKDQLGLLEAFGTLPDPGGGHRLLVVGAGPCGPALEAAAARPELAGRVTLLGERDDVPRVLQALDVFVLPSLAEGISNTILEAMATALPVVATRTGGNPELVEDGVTGRLVPVGDPRALAEALGAYRTDPHLARLHGKAGRQRAVEEFSLERMAARHRDLYRQVTGEGR